MAIAIDSYARSAFAPMPRVSFKGDQDSHLTELLQACQKKAVDDAVLKERALIPYFETPVDSAALQPLQGKAKGRKAPAKAPSTGAQPMAVDSANGAKQPRRKKGGKASPPADGAQAAPAQPTRKHNRDPSYRHLPGLAPSASAGGGGAAVSGRQSPPRKRQESQFYDTASSAPPVASRFAGPAFTNSPMPDALPIPTTSLLLNGLML